jgi:carnitine-CoA ligase
MLELDPERWTLMEALRVQAERRGASIFASFDDGSNHSFAGLDAASDACATGLASLGVGPGDRVLIMAENSAAFLTAFFGVQKRRAVLVPVNTELKGEFLAHQLRDSQPKVIIADRQPGEGWAAGLDGVTAFVAIGDAVKTVTGKPVTTFGDLCRHIDRGDVMTPEARDICLILYTSGTSGPSKGVVIPQAHAYLFGYQQARALSLTSEDRFFVALPMFHVNALLMSLGACLVTDAQAFIAARFSASQWLNQVRSCGATVSNTLGIMAEFILQQPETALDKEHRLRSVMAVPVSDQWGVRFEARFGVRLVQVYGMTECNIISFNNDLDQLQPGCAGRVSDEFFDVRIVDPETDRTLDPGAIGEIVVRPCVPYGFMQGYYNLPDTTVRAWRNLWFHTGDAGRLDATGRLYFVDRLGDCIRRRGENISSLEIEQVLGSHPDIAECAVIGLKIDGAGGEEEIEAIVVRRKPGLDRVGLLKWSEAHLPRYAVPRFWKFVDALEKTPTGKVKKRELRDRGVTAGTWDRVEAGYRLDRGLGDR